jgi:hypothetical protein
LNDSLWSGPERYRSINPDSAADELIKVKLHRNVATEAAGSQAPKLAAAAGHARDQTLRRLRRPSDGRCSGRDWRSPQANTPAKIPNIATTAAETSIESIGITTSF